MKRVRVSDIQKLLGDAAAARLVEGVKDLRNRKTYSVDLIQATVRRVSVEASSEMAARRQAERDFANGNRDDFGEWVETTIRSRMTPVPSSVLDRDGPHGLVDERIHPPERRKKKRSRD